VKQDKDLSPFKAAGYNQYGLVHSTVSDEIEPKSAF
jgi:hypothetical protein